MSRFAILSLACALLSACGATHATVVPGALSLGIDGRFGADEGGAALSTDLGQLGLGGDELAPSLALELHGPGRHVQLSGFDVGFSGQGRAVGEIRIDDVSIPAGADVASSLDLFALRGISTWDVTALGPADVGVGLGFDVVETSVRVRTLDGSATVGTDQTIPMPLVAARLALRETSLAFTLSAGLVDLSTRDADVRLVDWEAGFSARVSGAGGLLAGNISAGWRAFELDVAYDDGASRVDADIELAGPYVGLRFGF